MNGIENNDDVRVKKAELGNLATGSSLAPLFRAIEMSFATSTNEKQRVVQAKIEKGINEVNELNKLRGDIFKDITDDGFVVSADIEAKLQKMAMLDPKSMETSFANPFEIEAALSAEGLDLPPTRKEAYERLISEAKIRLKDEANGIEMLSRAGLGFTVPLDTKADAFNALKVELALPENANHPLKRLLESLAIGDAAPTAEQQAAIVAAANASDLVIDPALENDPAAIKAQTKKQFANRQIREKLQEYKLLDRQKNFTKRKAEAMTDTLNQLIKEKEMTNGRDSKESQSLLELLNKVYDMLITCVKKESDAIVKMASHIKGG